MQPRLARASDSALAIIDIQERLAAVMPFRELLVRDVGFLLTAASRLGIPVLVSEQYPKGLGRTIPEIASNLPEGATVVEKTAFSACGALPIDRPQVVMAGMEAHVCVLQTALDLAASGREVFVVADAVRSRKPANRVNAIARLRDAGIVITNVESVLFEWLRDASHEHFREISKLIR